MKDIYDFFSSIINSISWPITSIAIVLILKRQLTSVLNRLAKIKTQNLEAEFSRGLSEVKKIYTTELANQPEKKSTINKFEEEALIIADISPSAAIAFSYFQIQGIMNKIILEMENSITNRIIYSGGGEEDFLLKNNKINQKIYDVLIGLKDLKNINIEWYRADLPKKFAVDYIKLVSRVISELNEYFDLKSLSEKAGVPFHSED